MGPGRTTVAQTREALVGMAQQSGFLDAPRTTSDSNPGRLPSPLFTPRVQAGSLTWLVHAGMDTAATTALAADLARSGQIPAAVDGRLRLLLSVADPLRPDSPAGVAGLRALDLQLVLATGDVPEAAAPAAAAAGIGEVRAGLLPAGKSDLVGQLRREQGSVAMVGDGINDAPALAAADIGIAVATGTGAAMAAADITLVHCGVGAVADAVLLARATRRIIRQNLGWAFGRPAGCPGPADMTPLR